MDELRKLFMAGIAAVKPQRLISECLSRNSKTLRVNSIQESHSCEMILPDKGVHLFGFGKAASEMMQATIEIIGNENIASGIALVPKQEEELFNYHNWENITTFFGAKGNLPDEDSLKGSQKALKMIEGLDSDDLLLVLISGGGSALFEIPVDGISLNEEVEIVNQLSKSGATIAEINTVRKRLSKVKGGGLARMCKGKIIALIISDVIGDHLDVIASGTTVCNKDSSNAAFDVLSKHNIDERASFLHKIKEELLLQQSYIANILSRENGKPLPEAMGEVGFAASFFEWFAEEGRRAYGEHIPAPSVGKQIVTVREPAGVVAVITPWNFPIGMIARKVAALLAAGCTCVVKPAEDTPLTAIAFAKIVEKCGIPNGVFNLIPTSRENAPSIGKLFAESADISVISFTGSTVVGKQLYSMAGSSVKRIALELGGNAPFIVFNQADLALAVQGAMIGKWRNSGQTCVSANRIFVQKEIHDAFVDNFVAETNKLKVGRGHDQGVNVGPIINNRQFERIVDLVYDAVNQGAHVVTGGKALPNLSSQRFYAPTVLTKVTKEMRAFKEEIFGPVAAIIQFQTEEEVLQLANEGNMGLAGYFYTNDLRQAWRVARNLKVGMVGINDSLVSTCEAPFGGVRQSGVGKEGSKHGLDEYTNLKLISFGGLN